MSLAAINMPSLTATTLAGERQSLALADKAPSQLHALFNIAGQLQSAYKFAEIKPLLAILDATLTIEGCALGIYDPSTMDYGYIASTFDTETLPHFGTYPCSIDGRMGIERDQHHFNVFYAITRGNKFQFFIAKTASRRLSDEQESLIGLILPSIYMLARRMNHINQKLEEAGFTKREKEVARWIVEGKDNWSIANILGMEVRTVKFHNCNIFKKVGVSNRTELIVLHLKILDSINRRLRAHAL
jgi:DNA-binding CsgD family transcriptional regulator